jgi:hypothetical protein
MHRPDNRIEWSAYENKAASIIQERRSEEVQLEKLMIRLHDKIREAEGREHAETAA